MNLAFYARSNTLMRAALNDEIRLGDLESELLAMIAELDSCDDALLEYHVGGALLVLAELERGDRDEAAVRQALRDLIGEPAPAGKSRPAQG